jgi:hypothetical protein
MRVPAVLFAVLCSAAPAAAQVIPPTEWALLQTDPEPYCRERDGVTRFEFRTPETSEFGLDLWSADSTQVVRALYHGTMAAGVFTVHWNGLDEEGAALPNGSYPYVMQAYAPGGQTLLYAASRRLTIDCPTAAAAAPWGLVKRRFR